jgi:antitoxin (DNA-binding transcriptional repressor) of toxin-antitoxin stability system
MSTVTLAEAKTHLSHLLDQVEAGEEVVITARRAIARMPVEKPNTPSVLPSFAAAACWQPAPSCCGMRDEGL